MTSNSHLRINILCIASFLYSVSLNALSETPTSKPYGFSTIGWQYISSFGTQDLDDENDAFDPTAKIKLSAQEKRGEVFELFERKWPQTAIPLSYSPLPIIIRDLNLFFFQSVDEAYHSESLFSKINGNVTTSFGEAALAGLVANPTANVQELKKRQALVRAFVDDKSYALKIEKLLHTIKKCEDAYLSSAIDGVIADALNYTILSSLNTNPSAVGALVRLNELITVASTLLFPWELKKRFERKDNVPYQVIRGCFGAFLLAGRWCLRVQMHNVEMYAQRRLMDIRIVVKTFHTLLADPKLAPLVAQWKKTRCEKSDAYYQLLELLKTNTFAGKESYFSRIGRVHAAFALFQEAKDDFADMMRFIGLVDAYCAVAKLYQEYATKKNPYCFAEFIEQDLPLISATGFWNPMLENKSAVPNDIEIASTPTHGIMVTGSNSGGKSTIMINGLTSVVWLAQTIGIAPAKRLVMTPFDYIATSLKVQDNVANGQSHFVAETKHAASLIKGIKGMPAGTKAFLAIDELFEGTTADVGNQSLYEFAKELLHLDQLIFVISTQYQAGPPLLEEDSAGACKNYRIDVIKHEDGSVSRPYKLQEGVSQVNIGAAIFHEAMANL